MSITVSQARSLRRRYAEDDAYRERRKAYARTYYHQNRVQENARVVKWMSENKKVRCSYSNCGKPLFYNNKSGLCKKHWCESLGKRGKNK